jgi:hypothetical protein
MNDTETEVVLGQETEMVFEKNGITFVFQNHSIKFRPILILEAAWSWMRYSIEKGWKLFDIKGIEIDRDNCYRDRNPLP